MVHTCHAADTAKQKPTAVPTVPLMVAEALDDQGLEAPLRPEVSRLLGYMEKSMNLRFQIQRLPIQRITELLKEPDKLAFGMSITSERQNYMSFSEPVFNDYIWIVTREDRQFEFSTLTDLQGKSVGIVRGVRLNDDTDRYRNVLFRVEDDPSQRGARLKKLISGRMDCMLVNSRFSNPKDVENELNQSLIENGPVGPQADHARVRVLAKPLLIDPVHFATSKARPSALLGKINAAIRNGQANGDIPAALRP